MKKNFTLLFVSRIKIVLLVILGIVFNLITKGQPGSPDLTFNPTDTGAISQGFLRTSGSESNIRTIIRLQTGKYLVGGDQITYNEYPTQCITRLTNNGEIDPLFSTGIGFQRQTGPTTFANGVIYCLYEFADGKILVGGQFDLYRGQPAGGLIRLLPNGDPDPAFISGTGANNIVRAFMPMPDGKVLVGGDFTEYNGTAFGRLVLIQINGQPDVNFNHTGAGANGGVFAIDTLSSGEIIIGGAFTNYNSTSKRRLAKLEKNGTLIASFPSVQEPNNTVTTVIVEENDKIMLAGSFSIVAGGSGSIRRINGDGTLDPSFTAGTTANSITETLINYGADHYFAGGQFTDYGGQSFDRMVLLKKSDGTPETTFNQNNIGVKVGGNIQASVSAFPQGVIAGGSFSIVSSVNTGNIFKLDPNGNLDGTFNAGHSFYAGVIGSISPFSSGARVLRMIKQQDGKILVAGQFSRYFDKITRCIVRLNPNGTFDETFQTGLPGADHEILDMALQTDGKIVIVGRFSSVNGLSRTRIARLNADGSLDENFIPDGWSPVTNAGVNAVAIAPDGSIYIGGSFTSYFTNGAFSTAYKRLFRLNPDGKLDESFVPANINSGTIQTLLVQSNGKIVMGGSGLFVDNSNSLGNVLRFNTDGSLDNSFNNGQQTIPSNASVARIKFNKDSTQILIAGSFSTYGGVPSSGLTRVDKDGNRDPDFGRVSLVNAVDMEVLPDGRILAVGNVPIASQPGGNMLSSLPGVARISADGIFDTAWASGGFRARGSTLSNNENASSTMYACALSENRLLIGGDFYKYGEVPRTVIAAINLGEITTPVTWQYFEATTKSKNILLHWITGSEQNNTGFTIERSTNGIRFESVGFVPAAGNGNSNVAVHYHFTDADPRGAIFYYRLKQTDSDGEFSYSAIRKVFFENNANIRLWPNPMVSKSLLQIPENRFTHYQILDLNGRLVQVEKIGSTQKDIYLQRGNLTSGLYLLRLIDENKEVNYTLKLRVQ